MNEKLTKRLIDSLSYDNQSSGRQVCWDTEISGFGVRIYPSSKKSFILSYRQHGTKRLYTIGQYGNITLEQARDLARKKMGEVADGKDPLLNRQAAKKKHEWTVQKAFKEFSKKQNHLSDKHKDEVKRIFEKDVLPTIGKKPIDEVKKDHILKILDDIQDRGSGSMANHTLIRLSRFFNWCIERGLIESSPVYKISKPAPEQSRDRILSDMELKEIWLACDDIGYPFGPLVQFLILTGQRRGEAAEMLWGDYNEDEKLWTLSKEKTKSNRQHQVPLSDMAIEILNNALNMGDYIFTSSGDRPFENFSRGKKDLDQKLKKMPKNSLPHALPTMPAWTIHDLRRTCASGMARLGIAPHVVEKILNHSSGTIRGVAAIYNRYEYVDEMREALEKWEDHINKILKTEKILSKAV